MKKILIGVGIFVVFTSLALYFNNKNTTDSGVACTMEAKMCPDGSYVGRQGPRCEFSACPTESKSSKDTGTLSGTMTIGPLCPVEPCASALFAPRNIYVYTSDKKTLVKTITPDSTGKFSAVLPVGTYSVDVEGSGNKIGGAKGFPKTITIEKNKTVTLNIDIDTGIR